MVRPQGEATPPPHFASATFTSAPPPGPRGRALAHALRPADQGHQPERAPRPSHRRHGAAPRRACAAAELDARDNVGRGAFLGQPRRQLIALDGRAHRADAQPLLAAHTDSGAAVRGTCGQRRRAERSFARGRDWLLHVAWTGASSTICTRTAGATRHVARTTRTPNRLPTAPKRLPTPVHAAAHTLAPIAPLDVHHPRVARPRRALADVVAKPRWPQLVL